MKTYEAKVFIVVEANNEDDANAMTIKIMDINGNKVGKLEVEP